jgi:RNA polymerase sigma-B factor
MSEGSRLGPGGRLADERLLLEEYFRGRSPAVREELVERFLPLAISLANRYAGGPEPTEDLHQVASLGLVKAIEGFDPTLGHSFPSYAAPTILGELKRHFRDRGRQVHLPRGLQERIALIDRAAEELPTALGRAPSAADIAEHAGLGVEDVLEAMEAASARRPYSLDASVGPDDDGAALLVDTIGGEDPSFETVDYGEAISQTLEALPERERVILHLRFVEDLTQSEIADRVGISQMHVSRLLRRALDAVRQDVAGTEED